MRNAMSIRKKAVKHFIDFKIGESYLRIKNNGEISHKTRILTGKDDVYLIFKEPGTCPGIIKTSCWWSRFIKLKEASNV